MSEQNCWEFKGCGREPGGSRVRELGVCPAATLESVNGIHRGTNGGRSCWGIVGTLCEGEKQDSLAAKLRHCVGCEFREIVLKQEGALLTPAEIGQRMAS